MCDVGDLGTGEGVNRFTRTVAPRLPFSAVNPLKPHRKRQDTAE
jgi:hypothetical protein